MFKIEKVHAHCDMPCAVYDPYSAQYAALSVVRFFDLINEVKDSLDNSESMAKFVRLVGQKEEHAQIVKNEIVTIWGDYFKAPQFDQFPDVHSLVHSIMMDASKCKQGLEKQNALDLLDKVNSFADIFWQTKDVLTESRVSPYAPNLPIICPVLRS